MHPSQDNRFEHGVTDLQPIFCWHWTRNILTPVKTHLAFSSWQSSLPLVNGDEGIASDQYTRKQNQVIHCFRVKDRLIHLYFSYRSLCLMQLILKWPLKIYASAYFSDFLFATSCIRLQRCGVKHGAQNCHTKRFITIYFDHLNALCLSTYPTKRSFVFTYFDFRRWTPTKYTRYVLCRASVQTTKR